MTTPTANPVPSTAPQDLLFNAEKLDQVLNSTAATFTDRLGVPRRTVAGSMAALNEGVDAVEAQVAPAQAAIAGSVDSAVQASATTVQQFHEMLEDISLPDDLNATMVAFEGRSVQLALKDLPTIQQFGGAGDFDVTNPTVYTNNYNALVAAINTGYVPGRPRGRNIRLPFVMGSTNVYRFEGIIPSGYVKLVCDEGVVIAGDTFRFDDVIAGSPKRMGSVVGVTSAFSDYGDPFSGRGEPNRAERRKVRWMSDGERYRPVVHTIDTANTGRVAKFNWPNADGEPTWQGTNEVVRSGGTVTFSPAAGEGRVFCYLLRPIVGQEFFGTLKVTPGDASNTPWVLARTNTGHYGLRFNAGTNAIAECGKSARQSYVEKAGESVPGLLTHQSYFANGGIVSLRQDSLYGFSVMFNGLVVLQHEFPEPIQELAFGGFAPGPTTFGWTNLAYRIGAPQRGTKTRVVHVAADSRGADRYDAWPRFFQEAVNGGTGIRVPRVTNQGVPGTSISYHWNLLQQRAGQAGYTAHGFPVDTTDFLIALLTNDAQGAVNPQDSRNMLKDLVQWARADGIVPFLGLPESWYGTNNSGGQGQNTLRYGGLEPYRSAMLSVAAEFGCVVIDEERALGPLIANYVNPASAPYFPGVDPMLSDNIHPTAFAGMVKGYEWARAFLGYHAGIEPRKKSDWHVLDAAFYLNGWTPFPSDPVRWRRLPGDRIQWGGVAVPGSVSGRVAEMLAVPAGMQPLRYWRGLASGSSSTLRANISATVTLFDIVAGTSYVDFSNVCYDLD